MQAILGHAQPQRGQEHLETFPLDRKFCSCNLCSEKTDFSPSEHSLASKFNNILGKGGVFYLNISNSGKIPGDLLSPAVYLTQPLSNSGKNAQLC